MSEQKAEGTQEEVPPMYSFQLQPDNAVPFNLSIDTTSQNVAAYLPFASNSNLNPCSEGLQDAVNMNELQDDVNEGADNNNGNDGAAAANISAPGCCRRYSCCFPLIIVLLVWLMMISAEAFEHCQDCESTEPEYSCTIESNADYYCKSNKIQVCCYYEKDSCRDVAYPPELHYVMSDYFRLSMSLVIVVCLLPCLLPCALPWLLYHDCRSKKVSAKMQTLSDVVCSACFLIGSLGCSWTIFEYYRYPRNRCSTNSALFGIVTSETSEAQLRPINVWIMSQTTYCSFFSLILLCSFAICGAIALLLQCAATRRKKRRGAARNNNNVVDVAIAPKDDQNEMQNALLAVN